MSYSGTINIINGKIRGSEPYSSGVEENHCRNMTGTGTQK